MSMQLFPRRNASGQERRAFWLTPPFTVPLQQMQPPRTTPGEVSQAATPQGLLTVVMAADATEPKEARQ